MTDFALSLCLPERPRGKLAAQGLDKRSLRLAFTDAAVPCPVLRGLGVGCLARTSVDGRTTLAVLADRAQVAAVSKSLVLRRAYRALDWIWRQEIPTRFAEVRDVRNDVRRLLALSPIVDRESANAAWKAIRSPRFKESPQGLTLRNTGRPDSRLAPLSIGLSAASVAGDGPRFLALYEELINLTEPQ